MKFHALSMVLVACSTLLAAGAHAQDWPAKPNRIIVPYTPGGSSAIIARAISQPRSDALKQTVAAENKPGANGNTGTDLVAKSPADGYTLLLCDVGALAITPSFARAALAPDGAGRRGLHDVGDRVHAVLRARARQVGGPRRTERHQARLNGIDTTP